VHIVVISHGKHLLSIGEGKRALYI